jgi:hypothetical protein
VYHNRYWFRINRTTTVLSPVNAYFSVTPARTKILAPVVVCGVTIHPGDWIYADPDGVLVSPTELKVPQGGPVEKVGLTIPV